MRPLRRVMDTLEALDEREHADGSKPVRLDAVTMEDMEEALKSTKPAAPRYKSQYAWGGGGVRRRVPPLRPFTLSLVAGTPRGRRSRGRSRRSQRRRSGVRAVVHYR